MPDDHEVRITLGDIFKVQQEQTLLLTKMGSDIKRALDSLDRTKADVADHETRIRQLERKVWQVSGASSLAGALLGTLANFIWNK